MHVQIQPNSLGPVRDVVHRYTLRTLTLEWDAMTNAQFAQVDALVDLLGGRKNTIKVPWWPYQAMVGGGTGTVSLSGAHAAGATTLSTSGWGGTNPVVTLGDFIQINTGLPRLYRVIAAANHSGGSATIAIEPPLWMTSTGFTVLHLRNNLTGLAHPYLSCTMQLADPDQVQGQVFVGAPKPHLGRGIVLAFVEAHRTVY